MLEIASLYVTFPKAVFQVRPAIPRAWGDKVGTCLLISSTLFLSLLKAILWNSRLFI